MDVRQHLIDRHVQFERYCSLSYDDNTATFMLYDLVGNITGYQLYRPGAPKYKRNDEVDGRYYTYLAQPRCSVAVWGVETLHYDSKYVFIVEGIFDAVRVHNEDLPCLAVLQNNPKPLRNQLNLLQYSGRRVVAICDDDAAGNMLAKFGNDVVRPVNAKDLGDMSDEDIKVLFRKFK